MAAPLQKKVVTLKPRTVSGYSTEDGKVVLPHQQRYRIADKIKNPADSNNIQENHHIEAMSEPIPIVSTEERKHTSSVYFLRDNKKGTAGYFKPVEGAAWGIVKEGVFKPYRRCISDDRVSHREVLASDIAQVFQMDNIPKTTWTSVAHQGKSFGEGTFQLDAKQSLMNLGYTDETACFHDWEGVQKERLKNARRGDALYGMTPMEHKHMNREATLKNGGMDLAVFDFIIGNTDRHGLNYFVGKNSKTGEFKLNGIDHGLAFPNSTKFSFNDFKNSFAGLWNHAVRHGQNIDCTDKFKKVLTDRSTAQHLDSLLEKSQLTEIEQKGVRDRYISVVAHLRMGGTLKGNDLLDLLKSNLHVAP